MSATTHIKVTSLASGLTYGFISMILLPVILVITGDHFNIPSYRTTLIQVFGTIMVFVGGGLLVNATLLFAKHGRGGSPLPFDPPQRLVTQGIYKHIRNPMFTASALIWIGESLFTGSILVTLYAIGWILFNHIHLITQDEKWLTKRFGKSYLDYSENTKRYLPKLF